MNLENFKSKFDWKFYVTHHRIVKSIKNETRAWNHACKIGCKTSRDVFRSKELSAQFRTFMRKPNTKCISTVGGQIKKVQKSFVFIISSYNNQKWYKRNLNSIFTQTYKKWRIVYIDDASTDQTYECVRDFSKLMKMDDKILIKKNEKNCKQGYSRFIAFKECHDDEICCLLDGDDWLYDEHVLEKLNDIYNDDIVVTYGNYRVYENGELQNVTGTRSFPDDVIRNNSYQHHNIWTSVHLRTGLAKLFKSYPYEYLIDFNDELISASTDQNEMFWVLDRSQGKHRNANFTTMVYNKDASMCHENSYYNKGSNLKTKYYRDEIEYYLKLNRLDRFKKKKTMLIFTELPVHNKQLTKVCKYLNSMYRIIVKTDLIPGINDIRTNIDKTYLFQISEIKAKKICSIYGPIKTVTESDFFENHKKNVLVVTSGLDHCVSSGGIKTAMTNLIDMLRSNDKSFDILMSGMGKCSKNINLKKYFYEKYGANFNIADLNDKSQYYGTVDMHRSFKVLQYIESNNHYDTIIFHDFQGVGYYTMLAKRGGLLQSEIICYCHGNHYLSFRYGNKVLNNDNYFTCYMERKSVEYADKVVFVSDFNKRFYKTLNSSNNNNYVIPNYSKVYKNLQYGSTTDKTKVCFVSRLEILKGIDIFIEFVIKKQNELKEVHFIGNEVKINGISSVTYIQRKIGQLRNRIIFKTGMNSYDWIKYVKENNLLLIYPSRGETSSLVIREALDHNIPFIASNLPGIQEQIQNNVHELCLFKTDDILNLIEKYDNLTDVHISKNENISNDFHLQNWMNILNNHIPSNNTLLNYNPLITVIIPTINRYDELLESLDSIRNQTYKNIEIIIGDDGSSEEIKKKLSLLENNNTRIYFFNKMYKGRNCNECSKHANGEFILFFDDDDIAYPTMIQEYIKLYNHENYDMISCFADVFERQISNKNNRYISMSIGDCLEANIKNHLCGKGTFMIKKSVFKELDGYMNDTERTKWVDKRFYIKAQLNKCKIRVYPGPLYHYRKYSQGSLFYNTRKNTNHIQKEITLFDEDIQNLLHKHYFNDKLDNYKLEDKENDIDSLYLLKKNLIENFK